MNRFFRVSAGLPKAVGTDDVHQTETPRDAMISSAERAAKIKDEYDSLVHSIMVSAASISS